MFDNLQITGFFQEDCLDDADDQDEEEDSI